MNNTITKDNLEGFTFDLYEKSQLTPISRERLQAGTKVQTLEGEWTCEKFSRLAKDANGNIYPIAESILVKSYRLYVVSGNG